MKNHGELALLLDLYGGLLTERQSEAIELYVNEDQSLAEIAEHFGVSRQSVHEAITHGRDALATFESKLGLARSFERDEGRRQAIASTIGDMSEKLKRAAAILTDVSRSADELRESIFGNQEKMEGGGNGSV